MTKDSSNLNSGQSCAPHASMFIAVGGLKMACLGSVFHTLLCTLIIPKKKKQKTKQDKKKYIMYSDTVLSLAVGSSKQEGVE